MGEKNYKWVNHNMLGVYGKYVWPCYILLGILLFWHLLAALVDSRRTKAKILEIMQTEHKND